MSYDWELWYPNVECPHCKGTGKKDESPGGGQFTWNILPMYYKAMASKWTEGKNFSAMFDMRRAGDLIEIFKTGVSEMEKDPQTYRSMNPVNGWGNYDIALENLKAMLIFCEEHPNATMRVR